MIDHDDDCDDDNGEGSADGFCRCSDDGGEISILSGVTVAFSPPLLIFISSYFIGLPP